MNVGSVVQHITSKVDPFAEHVGTLMGLICGVGALLYMGSKVWKSMSSGEPLDIFPLLRPFVIAFFVVNFSLVKAPIDFLLERVERVSNGYLEKTFGTMGDLAKEVREKVEQEAKEREARENAVKEELLKENKNAFKRALEYLKDGAINAYVAAGSNFTGLITTIVSGILYILTYAFKMLITWYYTYMSMIYKCILGILGPIAFTVAIFPGFTNGITSWIAKYIGISLWPVIFGLFNYIVSSVQTELIVGGDYSQWKTAGLALAAAEWQSVLLGLIEIAAYLTVPKIVNWIVPNGDMSGALGGVKAIFSIIASAVGVATGGVAGAAAGAMKKAGAKMMKG